MARDKEPLSATLGEAAANRKGERETFAHALRRLREEAGYTLHNVARGVAVPKARIEELEDGKLPTKREFGLLCLQLRKLRSFPPPEFSAYRGGVVVVSKDEEFEVEKMVDQSCISDVTIEATEREVQEAVDSACAAEIRASGAYEEGTGIVDYRAAARMYLDAAITPEEREGRIESLRESMSRESRRALGIKLEDKKPLRLIEVAPALRECPRCHEKVEDLKAHRETCVRGRWRWEVAGWRTCTRTHHPHVWLREGGMREYPGDRPPEDLRLSEEDCPNHEKRSAPKSPASSEKAVTSVAVGAAPEVPTVPDSPASAERVGGGGLDLAERCIVLADMLWPESQHAFQLWPGAGVWRAAIIELGGPKAVTRAVGADGQRDGAVRGLAGALRAEVAERARRTADIAKILED